MANFGTRLSNIVFWISIAAISLAVFGGTSATTEQFFGPRHRFSPENNLIAGAGIVPSVAVWAIIQCLLTGEVKVLNPKAVLSILIAAATTKHAAIRQAIIDLFDDHRQQEVRILKINRQTHFKSNLSK